MLAEVKKNIFAVLISSGYPLTIDQLASDYYELHGSPIPIKDLGYPSVDAFVQDLVDVVKPVCCGSETKVTYLPTRNNKSIQRMEKLINNQKKNGKTRACVGSSYNNILPSIKYTVCREFQDKLLQKFIQVITKDKKFIQACSDLYSFGSDKSFIIEKKIFENIFVEEKQEINGSIYFCENNECDLLKLNGNGVSKLFQILFEDELCLNIKKMLNNKSLNYTEISHQYSLTYKTDIPLFFHGFYNILDAIDYYSDDFYFDLKESEYVHNKIYVKRHGILFYDPIIGHSGRARLTCINSLSSFWIQLKSRRFDLMELLLNNVFSFRTSNFTDDTQNRSKHVVVKFYDKFYRGIIFKQNSFGNYIFFIDYGFTKIVKNSDIHLLNNDEFNFMRIPSFLLHCSLPYCPESADLLEYFKFLAYRKDLLFEVECKNQFTYNVSLKGGKEKIDIIKKLVDYMND